MFRTLLRNIRHILGTRAIVCSIIIGTGLFSVFMLRVQPTVYLDLSCSKRIENIRRHYAKNNLLTNGYLVSWYDFPFFLKVRPPTLSRTFESCEYNNCVLSVSRADVCRSDAIIFKGRLLPEVRGPINRPKGQIWIFAEDEAPRTWHLDLNKWQSVEYNNQFNWSMTYDKTNTDIYLPYGEFAKGNRRVHRDFLTIAKSKTKDAVIVTSNCETSSLRLEYIKELQEYIDVDVLGKCGTEWKCGKQWIHDDCFSFLNTTYRYYLAFENDFCRGYRSEKLFDNFKYDILLVTRGEMSTFDNDPDEPKDAYISASNFKSAAELGMYLKSLSDSPEQYAKLLEKKSQYISLPYEQVYQRALCNICKRLNLPHKYQKHITNLTDWRDLDNACHEPLDISVKA